MLRESGIRSLVIVPLMARGRMLGLVRFGRSLRREPMNADDLKLAHELAARAALCLDNAQMYSNERRIAVTLQRNMLPGEKDIPHRPGLEIAHQYRPSTRAARVGGDWFDVIPLSGHRIALVIGDMMGHDIQAAANMGQLRAAMRTLARLDLEPVDLLGRLDDVVQRDAAIQYATCVYAVYDTVTRLCSIANAGHPAPLLRHRDRSTEVVPVSPGVPLGVGVGDPEFTVTDLVLPEDSTLVLYTDGLIERRGEDIDAGLDALRQALTQPAADVQELCDQVVERLHRRAEEDDLAVLMARAPFVPGHRSARWKMRPDPKSASHARALVRSTLASWDLDGLVDVTELLVSELVTNAVRHARGEIELRLAKGGTLVCEVADGDERMPRRYQADAADERGRGLLLVGELADDWGTRPTALGKVVWFEHALPDTP
jgi:serine phosphatase RsbU (regulator of sigma subunit)/anti-sigma regulatory factor (Ser/Thr protein kinase)